MLGSIFGSTVHGKYHVTLDSEPTLEESPDAFPSQKQGHLLHVVQCFLIAQVEALLKRLLSFSPLGVWADLLQFIPTFALGIASIRRQS